MADGKRKWSMLFGTSNLSTFLRKHIVARYCVGLTFVTGLSTLIAYAVHGWTWNSKFAGGRLTVTVPEFAIAVVLITLVFGISVDMWRSRATLPNVSHQIQA